MWLAGAPFILGAVLMLVTVAVTFTIDARAADSGLLKTSAEAKAEGVHEPLLPGGAPLSALAAAAALASRSFLAPG